MDGRVLNENTRVRSWCKRFISFSSKLFSWFSLHLCLTSLSHSDIFLQISFQQTSWFSLLDSTYGRSWAQWRLYLSMLKKITSKEPSYAEFWRCQEKQNVALLSHSLVPLCELKIVFQPWLSCSIIVKIKVVCIDFCKHFEGYEYLYIECTELKAILALQGLMTWTLRCLKKQFPFLHKIFFFF